MSAIVLLPYTYNQDGLFQPPQCRPARLPRRTIFSRCTCRCSRMCTRLHTPRVLLPHTHTQDGWFLQPERLPARLPRRTIFPRCICRCSRMRTAMRYDELRLVWTSLPITHKPEKKWLSTRKSAPHGGPRRGVLSPWRRRLGLPIPCHVHWPRSCCRRRMRAAAVCKEACYRGRAGCVPRHACSGSSCVRGAPVLRGYAAGAWTPVWVRGGGAWRRGRAACVSRVPSCSDADACRRWLGERVGS